MTMYYNAATVSFFDSVVNYGFIPVEATEILESEVQELLEEQRNGKILQDDGFGNPEAVDPPPLTNQEQIDLATLQILTILKNTAWTQAADETNVNGVSWALYRQEVRNIPLQGGFPGAIVWPLEP